MTYTPHRDERFDNMWELMNFIEENQCKVCRFRKVPEEWGHGHAAEYPMCVEVEAEIITEEPVAALDDKGPAGVLCSLFKLGDPPEPVDPEQLLLIEEYDES